MGHDPSQWGGQASIKPSWWAKLSRPPCGIDKSWAVHAVTGGKTVHEPHPAGRYRHQPAIQSQTNKEHNYRRFIQLRLGILSP